MEKLVTVAPARSRCNILPMARGSLASIATCLAVSTVILAALITRPALAGEPDFIHARSWQFMAERGGVSVGEPARVRDHYALPVTCDVSGIEAISRRPAVMHANLAWWRSSVRIDGDRIELTVLTAKQGPDAPSAKCGPADLDPIDPGRYRVVYRDPDGTIHPLRTVVVPR